MACLAVLERMGRDNITVHGFRSTFRDWAAERTNFPREVVEMALAHVIPDKTEAAYRRGDLFEKRRKLMEAWTWLDATWADSLSAKIPEARPRRPGFFHCTRRNRHSSVMGCPRIVPSVRAIKSSPSRQ